SNASTLSLQVSRPVLDPAPILPGADRPRGEFKGFLRERDSPFGIAALRVGTVDQVPARLRQRGDEAVTGDGGFRVEFDGLAVTVDGLVQLLLSLQRAAEVDVGGGRFRVEFDGLAEGGDGPIVVA